MKQITKQEALRLLDIPRKKTIPVWVKINNHYYRLLGFIHDQKVAWFQFTKPKVHEPNGFIPVETDTEFYK